MMNSENGADLNGANLRATRGKVRGDLIKGLIGGMIAMAIIFTVVNMIKQSSYQDKPIVDSERQSTVEGSPFYSIVDEIAQLETRSYEEADISLHASYNWEEPVESHNWATDANYRVSLPLPQSFMETGHKVAVDVNYPDMVAAGETGTITITAKDENGIVRTGKYLLTPSADLYLAHGDYSEPHGKIIGDAIDIADYSNRKAIVIDFCTFANEYDGERSDDLSARTGACPTTVVLFNHHLNFSSEPTKNAANMYSGPRGGYNRED